MSQQIFTPSNAIESMKERDWAAHVGMMDWDSTKIVFTKRSLVEFLKQLGITIDPNFITIAKLPNFATFGKITGEVNSQESGETLQSESSAEPEGKEDNAAKDEHDKPHFRPSRRVRTEPGGVDSISLDGVGAEVPVFKPSRRVRQGPGGPSSIGDIFAPMD